MALLTPPTLADVEAWMHRVYIGRPGTTLRREERQKALEAVGVLEVIAVLLSRSRRDVVPTIVDAAAGKAYIGWMISELVLARAGRAHRVFAIERDAAKAELARAAIARLDAPGGEHVVLEAAAGFADPWPSAPTIVTALHACGAASDEVIDASIAVEARHVLLVPCCTSRVVSHALGADRWAPIVGVPEHGAVRQSFAEAIVASERTLRFEAAGYHTEVASFVAPTITPHHLMWRARRVCEPVRMARAAADLARLRGEGPSSARG
jgi:threonine dehydrogenase-like Zn-dependent dehydrogenase